MDSVLEKLGSAGKVERAPMMDGKKMTVLLLPNKVATKAKAQTKSVPKPTA